MMVNAQKVGVYVSAFFDHGIFYSNGKNLMRTPFTYLTSLKCYLKFHSTYFSHGINTVYIITARIPKPNKCTTWALTLLPDTRFIPQVSCTKKIG
jgi:hypothetical protein